MLKFIKRFGCKHEYEAIDEAHQSEWAGCLIDYYIYEISKCKHCGKKVKKLIDKY